MAMKKKIKEMVSKMGNAKVKDVARMAVAPINPMDTKSKLNIGGNIVRGAEKVGKVIKKKWDVNQSFRNKNSTKEKYEEEYARVRSSKPFRF